VLPIALVGNLSRDLVDRAPPRIGGAPFYAAQALRELGARATILARCGPEELPDYRRRLARLGIPVTFVAGTSTASFAIRYDGDSRTMRVEHVGDAWTPSDVAGLRPGGWVHAAPLLRSDFPPETLAALARRRRLSYDGQGLVREPSEGPLRLDGRFDPELLRHLTVLKLAEEEAEVLVDSVDPDTLAELGVPEVVVTFGSRGSLVVVDGRSENVRAHDVATDPTGSGDAFAAAYVASRARGHGPFASARRATALVGALLSARR
jgi:sugar/nucleoside kinase (ribokinase family)